MLSVELPTPFARRIVYCSRVAESSAQIIEIEQVVIGKYERVNGTVSQTGISSYVSRCVDVLRRARVAAERAKWCI